MIKSMKLNLAGLARFSGRTSREDFWPYAITAFIVVMVIFMVPFMILLTQVMESMMRFAADHPEQANVAVGSGGYSVQVRDPPADMMAPMKNMGWVMAPAILTALVLLGAAVARRLHDRGLPGFLGLAPLPFLTFAMILMPKLFVDQDFSQFGLMFLNNLVYIASLVGLVVLLCGRSTAGANRYGSNPKA
jgi:uncharacterized membrane protein YhaH (DUF805 family)